MTVQNKKTLKKLELKRTIWHIAAHALVGLTYLYAQPTPSEALICLVPFSLAMFIGDVSRLLIPSWNLLCMRHCGGDFMREHESHTISALTLSVLGITLSVWLFPREVAACAILFSGFVDPMARLVGVLWGKIRIAKLKKTFVGLAGGVAAGLLLAFGLSVHLGLEAVRLTFGVLAAGSLSASVLEVFAGRFDNLVLPLGSAGVMVAIL